MTEKTRPPLIWMNVTSSKNWSRPAVGIIRMEQIICEELSNKLGDAQFRPCVWLDNRFIAWPPIYEEIPAPPPPQPPQAAPIPQVSPRPIWVRLGYVYPRRFAGRVYRGLKRRLLAFFSTPNKPPAILVEIAPEPSIPKLRLAASNQELAPGDILISMGLDWDYPYFKEFFTLSKQRNIQIISCCYDLIPVLFPQYCVDDVAQKFQEYLTAMTWGSSGVLCISEQTKRDYQDFCTRIGAPQRPAMVVKLGDRIPTGDAIISNEVKAVLAAPFILFVSTIERRKNHEVIYRAFHLLARAGHRPLLPKLIFVGMQGWGVNDLLKDISLDPLLADCIVHLSHVSDTELNALYSHAKFCVYPSLYEGWGLPIAEALAMGKFVLSSDQGSLKEVGGDLVHYLPPWNADAWAEAILNLLQHPELILTQEQIVKLRYIPQSWSSTADSILQFIDNMVTARFPEKIILHPGYDSHTEIGSRLGPSIQSQSTMGLLSKGPQYPLTAGHYQLDLFATPLQESTGELHIDLVAKKQSLVLWQGVVEFSAKTYVPGHPTFKFEFSTTCDLNDLEFICHINSGRICLNQVVISKKKNASIANLVATIWNENLSKPSLEKQIFVDISQLIQFDSRTGIQRVVRNVLLELRKNPPSEYAITPVYCFLDHGYRLATHRTTNFYRVDQSERPFALPNGKRGDIFLGLDLQPTLIPLHANYYDELREKGIDTYFVVYDILILQMPQYFPDAAHPAFTQWLKTVSKAKGLLCISKTVAEETKTWLAQTMPDRVDHLTINWFHLGSDVSNSLSTNRLPHYASNLLHQLHQIPSFLMVGTIEPRKGHQQTLHAFSQLWQEGCELNLVIVGQVGWMMEEFVQVMRDHPKIQKHLFFLEGISDEFLEQLYATCIGLIAASEGEGFGLPLIEAAHHQLALIARDIPVFREVAGNHASYFSGTDASALAAEIKAWLVLHSYGKTPRSQLIPYLSWEQSTANLLQHILPRSA